MLTRFQPTKRHWQHLKQSSAGGDSLVPRETKNHHRSERGGFLLYEIGFEIGFDGKEVKFKMKLPQLVQASRTSTIAWA